MTWGNADDAEFFVFCPVWREDFTLTCDVVPLGLTWLGKADQAFADAIVAAVGGSGSAASWNVQRFRTPYYGMSSEDPEDAIAVAFRMEVGLERGGCFPLAPGPHPISRSDPTRADAIAPGGWTNDTIVIIGDDLSGAAPSPAPEAEEIRISNSDWRQWRMRLEPAAMEDAVARVRKVMDTWRGLGLSLHWTSAQR